MRIFQVRSRTQSHRGGKKFVVCGQIVRQQGSLSNYFKDSRDSKFASGGNCAKPSKELKTGVERKNFFVIIV